MIVKMKKITLLMSAKAPEKALRSLQKLGVLHVHQIQKPESEEIGEKEKILADLERALQVLTDEGESKTKSRKPAKDLIEEILELSERRQDHLNALEEQRQNYGWFDNWGEVSYASVRALEEAGIKIRFYTTDKGGLKKIPGDKAIHVSGDDQAVCRVTLFADSEEDRLEFKEDPMPNAEYHELKASIQGNEKAIERIDKALRRLSAHRHTLDAYRHELEKQLEFTQVLYGLADEDQFVHLRGFCPEDCVAKLKKTADREGWAYAIETPDIPIEAPTLIRNPGWLRIIDPLFKFMGTLPGYDEFDISFWFLIFFSLFFGMLIGDAGYGLVFMGLTALASAKAGKNVPREPFRLFYVLSGATIIWGLITGNWFGYEKFAQLPFLDRMVIEKIDSFATDNSLFMMYLCFVIGIIHLSIAHGIRAFRIINSPKALGELGWIGILWTLFFVAGGLVIGKKTPSFIMPLFAVSVGLTLVFSNFQKNVLKGIGATIGDLPLSIISSFSDIVSYLRLFAVGFASVTVASSFNDMAIGSGIHSVASGIIAAFILILGHSLNVMLGLMSVVVHGVRLNMLEFSGHLNMQWAGKPYRPFRE